MELLAAFAVKLGVRQKSVCEILECVTTEEAVRILDECGKKQYVMDYAIERISYYLNNRAKGKLDIDCIIYSNEFGELAKSKEVAQWFTLLAQEQAQ
jgi:cobalt-precorrin-5B (C1)-methyltransferase